MYLNKLLLKEFGKFNNKEIELKPGINLIYGSKEAGKTTIRDFVVDMLFGIDKSRGLGNEDGELRKPVKGNGFSGKAYINVNGKSCLIERSFLRHNRRTSVLDIQNGREIKLTNSNRLNGTLFDMDKNTYANIMCMNQTDADADDIGRSLKNLVMTGSCDIDTRGAIDRLKTERSKFDTSDVQKQMDNISVELDKYKQVEDDIKDIRRQISELDEEFAMETARRKREARHLIETDKGESFEDNEEINESLDELTKHSIFLDPELIKDLQPEPKLTDKLWFIILTGLFVIGVISAMVYILPFETGVRQLFIVCTILFVIVTIVEGLYSKGVFDGDVYTPSEEEFKRVIYELERKKEAFEDVEIDMSFATEYMDKKAKLRENEQAYLEKKRRKDELELEYSELAAKREVANVEIHAINLAINTINELSSGIRVQNASVINGKAGDIVSKLTDGRYTDVQLDDKLNIKIKSGSVFVGTDSLDGRSKRQVVLAIRIALARVLCKDRLPLVIDDIFVDEDEELFADAIQCINTIDTDQIIFMTSKPKLGEILSNIGVEFNYVEL